MPTVRILGKLGNKIRDIAGQLKECFTGGFRRGYHDSSSSSSNDDSDSGSVSGERLIALWYTQDLYLCLLQHGSVSQWESVMKPEKISSFIESSIMTFTSNIRKYRNGKHLDELEFRLVAMDGRYLDWLQAENLTDSLENRIEYAAMHTTPEETLRILKEKKSNLDIRMHYLVVMHIGKADKGRRETSFRLDDASAGRTKAVLEKTFGQECVHMTGYVLAADIPNFNRMDTKECDKTRKEMIQAFVDMEDRLESLANTYFYNDGMKAYLSRFDTQEYKNGIGAFEFYLIPFAVKKEIMETSFIVSDYKEKREKENHVVLTSQDTEELLEIISPAFNLESQPDREVMVFSDIVVLPYTLEAIERVTYKMEQWGWRRI